ncbi:MAG: hypothetical protein JKY01_05715 [Pseudomonadales bacterium]|nr:hypothetical protein [Pseudomonadales bacterium]
MNTNAPTYNNTHLLLASLLTAGQLFAVAAFFNQVNPTYATIIALNSILLPLIMAYKTPRRISNLIPLFHTLFKLGFAGFLLAGLISVAVPRAYIDNNPIILEFLSTFVAVSATLPPSILPFSFSLIVFVVLFKAEEQ